MTTGTDESKATPLLPVLALRGQRIGISVSASADLARLGLMPEHFQLALRELARTVLVGGGTLAYGGHLVPGGFTEFLVSELGQYARTDALGQGQGAAEVPLLICLSNQEHRNCSIKKLERIDTELGVHGELQCIDLDGKVVTNWRVGRGEEGEPYPSDPKTLAQGLTALRRCMAAHTAGRMLLGGKRQKRSDAMPDGYTGDMPGVLQEALLALERDQPLYLAAGFGGVTLNIACAVDLSLDGFCPRHSGDPALDDATAAALSQVRSLVGTTGWDRMHNGLDAEENRQLAMTHRPTEIAALVALGLGRIAQGGR